MDNVSFGITMLIVGMGGTLLTLWIISVFMTLLKKAFPLPRKADASEGPVKKGGEV